jgi:membrane fusion protein, heavy metal efflux system
MPDKPSNPDPSAQSGSDRMTDEITQPRSTAGIFADPTPTTRLTIRGWVIAATLALAALIAAAYWLWPRPKPTAAVVEKSSAAESKRAGEESEKSEEEHSQKGAVEVDEETAKLIGLKTEEAAEGQVEETIAAAGKILAGPNSQAVVGAKVDGRAVRVLAEPGQTVSVGKVLVVVDSPQVADLRGQLTEARERLQLAEQKVARVGKSENRAPVIQAKNRLDLSQATLERKRRLSELGAASGRELAEAEMEYKNAKAEYDFQASIQITREQQEAASEVAQTGAAVARLNQSLSALGASPDGAGGIINITSPISGMVADRHITIGQTVSPDKELLTVMNTANVVVEAQFPESQANRVRVGQRLIARIPGTAGRTFEGKISSVGNTVDPAKRTVAVRAAVPNAGGLLKHEMAVEAHVVYGRRKDALLVPVSALVEDEGIKVVYVKEGNRYERRSVEVGAINFQSAEILSGVKAGEEVVTASAYQLKNMTKGGGEEGGHHDDH